MSEIKKVTSEQRMGTAPILPLITKMALPSVFSMLIQALYNIVDSMFVAQISETALSAVSLVFPAQLLNGSVAIGTGIGIASLISRKLGEGRIDDAQSAASHSWILGFLSWLPFLLFGLFGSYWFAKAFSDNPVLIEPAAQYCKIICSGSYFIINAIFAERIMQACSNMIAPMLCSLTGCITNIILDPIMIFGYFGCPALGVAGAAYATIIGQMVSFTVTVICSNTIKNMPVKATLRKFRFNRITVKQIYGVGLPAMLMQSLTSITTLLMNAILITFSETAVAVLGVYFKLQSFVFMPVFGLNQGTMPILGYNFGARNRQRLEKTLKIALVMAFSFMSLGTIAFQLIPENLMKIFDAKGEMMTLGVQALRTISFSFPLAAISIIPGALFQASGHGTYSLIQSVLRQIVLIVPLAFIFSRFLGARGVWLAYPCAECVAVCFTFVMFRRLYNNEIKKF